MSEVLNREVYPNIPGAVSQEYHYTGFWGCQCVCGLQYGRNHETGKDFVILTELSTNQGTSVTNMVEHLATQVLGELGLDPANTLIFEHYPERGNKWDPFPESWDLVIPDWENGEARVPQGRHMWQHITREEALALIGDEEEEL